MYPDDLKYTAEHEWLRDPGQAEGSVRVGITSYAQDALGDIVFVQLPEVGDTVTAGETCGELESTKSVSDLYSPVNGEVTSGAPSPTLGKPIAMAYVDAAHAAPGSEGVGVDIRGSHEPYEVVALPFYKRQK